MYTDGAFNATTKPYAWATVVDEKKEDLVVKHQTLLKDFDLGSVWLKNRNGRMIARCHFDDVKQQQNNGAELTALVMALVIGTQKDCEYKEIYCDSTLLLNFWSKGQIGAATKLIMDPKKLALIERCAELRTKFEEMGGALEFVAGKDNPADFGWHQEKNKPKTANRKRKAI